MLEYQLVPAKYLAMYIPSYLRSIYATLQVTMDSLRMLHALIPVHLKVWDDYSNDNREIILLYL